MITLIVLAINYVNWLFTGDYYFSHIDIFISCLLFLLAVLEFILEGSAIMLIIEFIKKIKEKH